MKFNYSLSKIITFLISFILFLRYIGGPFHLMNIGIPIGLTILLSIIYNFYSSKIPKNSIYIYIYLIFIYYLFIGSMYSNAPNYGREKTFLLSLFVILAIFSVKHIVANINSFLMTNFFFYILYIIAYFSFYGSLGNVLSQLDPRIRLEEMGGEVFGVIDASRYIGFCLISMFFLFFHTDFNLKFKKLIFIFMVTIGILIMLLFGSKGPLISLILSPIIYLIFYKKISLMNSVFLSLSIGILIFILLSPKTVLNILPQQYQTYFEYRFFDFETYQNDRPSLFKMALEDIDEKSLILGKGTGNFGYLITSQDVKQYPHNIFVEILYENGLLGLLFFLFLLIKALFRNKREYFISTNSYLIITVYYFLLNAQVTGDFDVNSALFVFLIFKQYPGLSKINQIT